MAGIKGMKHKRPRAKKHSDAIEASKIENLLADHYSGEGELSSTQLKAIEIRYARLKPTLAAIEQTVVDPRDKQDPAQLAQKLAAMFAEKPELWEQVSAIRNQAVAQEHKPAEATLQ
jgi:hypothetical protein